MPEVPEMGQYKKFGLILVKGRYCSVHGNPLGFRTSRPAPLAGTPISRRSPAPPLSQIESPLTSNLRPFNSTLVFIPRCDIRQDVSALVCPILNGLAHRKSDLFVVAIQKVAHKFPSNPPNV